MKVVLQDIVREVAKTTKLALPDARVVVNRLLSTLEEGLLNGQRIEIRDFGVFQTGRKQYREALQHFIHARELGAGDAEMFNFMGICYSQTGQPQKAIESLRQAIAIDPMLAEAHLNLGYAYERQHSKAAADEYAEACKLASRFCGLRPK